MRASWAFAALALVSVAPAQPIGSRPPKLVLLISVDQFRNDYVERFQPYFLPAKSGGTLGGIRFLTETGIQYLDAHYNHIPTATGPGHAILMTGSIPAVNGIIGNDWWDRVANEEHYVVDDKTVKTVGGKSKPMSPRPLKVTTVGDELKLATNGKSRVVGVSFKDRAAILMAGHAADEVVWFDGSTGNMVTSTFYARDGKLPAWVQQINDAKTTQSCFGKKWEPVMPAASYGLTVPVPGQKPAADGKVFSHEIGSKGKVDKTYFTEFTTSPFGQQFIFDTVQKAIDANKLGQHDVPDVLVVNLATNDYIGHKFGPNSAEVLDISVHTDRLLSKLFNSLNKSIPGGIDNVAIIVTADHGVAPIPEVGEEFGLEAHRFDVPTKAIVKALNEKYGEAEWLLGEGLYEQNVFLNRALIASKGLSLNDVSKVAAEAAAKAPGVFTAFTRDQLMNNQLPTWPWTQRVLNGFHPFLGGDLMVIESPGTLFGEGTGTSHGSPWAYDTHVPILFRVGGQKPQKVSRTVYTYDIASTVSQLLGIEYPSGNVGHPLVEVLSH